MPTALSTRFGIALVSVAAAAAVASADPPRHVVTGRADQGMPYYNSRGRYVGRIDPAGVATYRGYGTGLYSSLGYGLNLGSFGYSGLPYGGIGYGALGYGFGYPSSALGGMTIPIERVKPPTYYTRPVEPLDSRPAPTLRPLPAQPQYYENPERIPDPAPVPLPLPGSGAATTSVSTPATVTVVAGVGATVTFDGAAGEQSGTAHTFTTKPIAPGKDGSVNVKVSGPDGASSLNVTVRAGEKVTVDLRR